MNDNPKMVDLPWHDGTTRTVPEWTVYESTNGCVHFALDGRYSSGRTWSYPHFPGSAAVRIFTEAPEPPVKVEVPTKIAAVVSLTVFPDDPGFVLTRDGWRGLRTYSEYDPSEIASKLSRGARVLFEGIEESEKSL